MIAAASEPAIRAEDWNLDVHHLMSARLIKGSRTKPLRTISQWAEEEVIIPTGQFADRRYRIDRQPFTRHWFSAIESGQWSEFCGTGPSQSGKSLSFFVIPILYYLLEWKETVIVGLPTLEMAKDKWERDLLPVLERTSYRDLLPSSGSGSRGGHFSEITLRSGATLKFMSGGGDDKSRAYFTSRVIVFTETDGMSRAQSTSQEANPIEQIKARARSYPIRLRRIFGECTVTDEHGYIWDSIHRRGTATSILLQCPHCKRWATPGREDLHGWQESESDVEAAAQASFYCRHCGEAWSEKERVAANATSRLIHKGQTLTDTGEIVGEAPKTLCFGFRFSAVNNCLLSAGDVAVDEWEAMNSEDDPDTEKKLCQFVWALPYSPPSLEQIKLDRDATAHRQSDSSSKGRVPPHCNWIGVGVDAGKYRCHWTAIAFDQTNHKALVFDYGTIELKRPGATKLLDANDLGFEEVWSSCVGEWRERVLDGWPSDDGSLWTPDRVLIDARYQGDDPERKVIYDWLRRIGDKRFVASIGVGSGQADKLKYRHPAKHTKVIQTIGHYYYVQWNTDTMQHTVHIDSDQWKTITHAALAKEMDQPGALTLYQSMNPNEHKTFVKHLTAEHRVSSFKAGKGHVRTWEVERDANHWLDSTVYAFTAGHMCGWRMTEPNKRRQVGMTAVPPGDVVGLMDHLDNYGRH